jgi:hypothetical protein
MYTTTKLNDQTVDPILTQSGRGKKVIGQDLFPDPYGNIGLFGRKKQGKTSTIFKILEECVTPETTVLAFVSTIHKDANWQHIQKWCQKKKIPFVAYTSLAADGKGGNHLSDLLNFMKSAKEEDPPKEDPKLQFKEPDVAEKKKEPRHAPLDYLIIFDDLGNELRDKYVAQLLKTNRHYRSKVIVSTQYTNDLKPESRKQIDVWLLFGKLSDKNLETIYEDADLPVSFEVFRSAYKQATAKPFNFLYVDTLTGTFRINFAEKINVPSS